MTVRECVWRLPPSATVLSVDDVHIWRAWLDQPASTVRQLADTLSADERARAERFHFEQDRSWFLVSHGLLRIILGRYLGIEPGQLQFSSGPLGKPALADSCGDETLRFNLAHSHGLALYALTCNHEIGIDVEHVRPVPDAEQIAKHFFSAFEVAMWQSLPPDQQLEAFFTCWTRKEAFLKAVGHGLSQPMDQLDVSLAPGEPARLLPIDGNPQLASRWTLHALTPDERYVAALAVEGTALRFTYYDATPHLEKRVTAEALCGAITLAQC